MSDLLKQQFGPRLPKDKECSNNGNRKNVPYQPLKWSKFFNIRDDIEIESGTFRIYRRGVEGPLLFFIHGGGFSALSWALLSTAITNEVRCQCLAVDMRGHGDTHCANESDFSIETISGDVIKIIFAMFPTEAPPIILIGHSMGGAVAVHIAHKHVIPSLAGLVVIDVVEGTALDSLYSMTTFLRNRPQGFRSLSHGIEWCVRSGQIRNPESARVSFPGQLKRLGTGESATSELDRGVARVEETTRSTSPIIKHSLIEKIRTNDQSNLSGVVEVDEPRESDVGKTPSITDVNDDLSSFETSHLSSVSSEPDSRVEYSTNASPHTRTSNQVVLKPQDLPTSQDSNTSKTSTFSNSRGTGEYTWRIDLSKTEQFWRGWFENLSPLFLSINEPKLLIIAGIDRLDKELTIGQMQGKFQLQILPQSGHAVHEDSPDKVASCLANFLVRNRFTQAKANFDK